ncbi:MAG: Ser-Thr-rich GPI-anchored membrane family protein [bacterium]|nr:Ser-Thr-rich GPI-anchored membrane family protein [bacterium]
MKKYFLKGAILLGALFVLTFGAGSADAASIILTSPIGGEQWTPGSTHAIGWETTGFTPYDYFEISIVDTSSISGYQQGSTNLPNTGHNYHRIAGPANSLGSFSWTVPDYIPAGTKYVIKMEPPAGSSTAASVTNFITITDPITQPPITITSPSNGEQWQAGTTRDITWTSSSSSQNTTVMIIIYDHVDRSHFGKMIASSVPASAGKYSWTIPASLDGQNLLSNNLRISIGGDYSDYFSIVEPPSTPALPPEITPILIVDNKGVGTKRPSAFKVYIDGTVVTSGLTKVLSSGSRAITTTTDPKYTQTFSGDCTQSTITLNAGDQKTCIITQTFKIAQITPILIVKGGTKKPINFSMYVDGWGATQGLTKILSPGAHKVTATTLPGYKQTYSGGCTQSIMTLEEGDNKRCIITNTYTGPVVSADSSQQFALNEALPTTYTYGQVDGVINSLQKFLNKHGFTVAKDGPGSPGNETNFFGVATKAALQEFQAVNGLLKSALSSGNFGPWTASIIESKYGGF